MPTATVPSGIEDVTAPWLSEVLGAPSRRAFASSRSRMDTGFSSLLYRVHLTGSDVPGSVIVKLPADSEARGAMEMMGGYTREVAFYREVADRAPTGTPTVYAARMAREGSDFVLVLEDLRDWDNVDHLAGLTLDQARLVIAELAACTPGRTEPPNVGCGQPFPSIDTPMMRDVLPAVFAAGWQVYREHSDADVAPSVAARRALRRSARLPRCAR